MFLAESAARWATRLNDRTVCSRVPEWRRSFVGSRRFTRLRFELVLGRACEQFWLTDYSSFNREGNAPRFAKKARPDGQRG